MKALTALVVAAVLGTGAYLNQPTTEIISYQVEADYGDTVWSLCGKVATDDDNLMDLIQETIELNDITDVGELQPGKVIKIQVKRPVG